MKQYYQFMLRGVVTDAQGLQTNANIDEFEEDLHKMLVVRLLTFLPPLLRVTEFLNSQLYFECVIVAEIGLWIYALLKGKFA